jgi:hypothetical protein
MFERWREVSQTLAHYLGVDVDAFTGWRRQVFELWQKGTAS